MLSEAAAIHEFGHHLQYHLPDLDAYFIRTWEDRTQSEKTKPLNFFSPDKLHHARYNRDERGKEDNFAVGYMGKTYNENGKECPSEMLTMTFEALLGKSWGFFMTIDGKEQRVPLSRLLYEKDRDLLHLGLGLLTHYKP